MTSLNGKLRDLFVQPTSVYAKPVARRIVLGLAFFFLFMIILSTDFISNKVFFEVGQVSDRDVISPRTFAYVDVAKTKKLEAEVLASVVNVYDVDIAVIVKAEENIGTIFKAVHMVFFDKTLVSAEQKIEKIQQFLPVMVPNAVMDALLKLDEKALGNAGEQTKSIVRKYFQRGIRDDDLDMARKTIVIETEELGLGKNTETVVAGLGQVLLQPNFIFNARETDKRKQLAITSVEPVRETVKNGQIIIRRGDVVTAEQIHAMEEVGLSKGHVSEIRIFGLAIFILMIMAIVLGYMYKFAYPIYQSDVHLLLLGFIILVTLLLGKVAHYYSDFASP